MSFSENNFSAAHLRGKVVVDRNPLATLRAKIKRSEPDGSSAVPYYPSASGKTLRITYTKEVSTVVTDFTVNVAISSNSLANIITAINAVDPTNLQGLDLGGYLGVRNLNLGKTHRIEINKYTTTPSNDAAPVFGFITTPYPGGTAFVYERASTPGLKQGNPQGTSLIGGNEDFTGSSLNRAFDSLLDMIEKGSIDLDAPVIGYKDVALTFSNQAATGQKYAAIADNTIRVPILGVGGSLRPQSRYFKILKDLGSQVPVPSVVPSTASNGAASPSWSYPAWSHSFIYDVVYGAPLIDIDISGTPFSAWGTPDGKTIYHASVPNKDKHASVTISSIEADVIYCAGAQFQTKKVAKGDPVFLTAATLSPFDHTGWFAVRDVYDEEHIALRPLSPREQTPAAGNKPRSLNPDAAGTLRVAVGFYIPAGDLLIVTDGSLPTSAVVRIATAMPLREALAQDVINDQDGYLSEVLGFLSSHIGDANRGAHTSEGIRSPNAGSLADGTSMSHASTDSLKQFLQDLITHLGGISSGTLPGGTNKIGSAALSIGGATPNTVSSGTAYSQLVSLLTTIRDHINSTTAHAAVNLTYGGGGAWADGTTNPAASIEAQLDKIISDLSPSTGGAKIGGAASGTDIAAGTINAQIANLAVNWFKMSRNNSISGAQTFTAILAAAANILVGANKLSTGADARTPRLAAPYTSAIATHTLIYESAPATGSFGSIRIYSGPIGTLLISVNAFYDGTNWNKDVAGTTANLWLVGFGKFEQYAMVADAPWAVWTNIIKTTVSEVTTVANPKFEPLLQVYDSANQRRVALDHNGFRMGRVSEYSAPWMTASAGDWTPSTTGTGIAPSLVPSRSVAGTPFSSTLFIALSVATGVGTSIWQTTNQIVALRGVGPGQTFNEDACVVLEWEAADTLLNDTESIFATMGITDGTNGVFFQSQTLTTNNWQFITGSEAAGLTTTVDTGVSVSNSVQRFRVEVYGANLPGGARCLSYINGALVGQSTTNLPDKELGVFFSLRRTAGTGVQRNLYISPITLRMRRHPSDDAL
jgi:hypothetical protein